MTEPQTEKAEQGAMPEDKSHETIASEFSFLARTFLEKLQIPKQDIEKNVTALFTETVSKMDLVTRSELERQQQLLQQSQVELAQLKAKIEQLENAMQQTQ